MDHKGSITGNKQLDNGPQTKGLSLLSNFILSIPSLQSSIFPKPGYCFAAHLMCNCFGLRCGLIIRSATFWCPTDMILVC